MTIFKSWLQSSQDPTKISQTIKGIVLGASAIIIYTLGHYFHVILTPNDILSLATQLGAIGGAVYAVAGLLMKGVVKMGTVKPIVVPPGYVPAPPVV